MSPLRYIEGRKVCTDKLLKQLRALGFDTDGYVRSLEAILKSNGFGLPKEHLEDNIHYYHFMINYKWIRYYLNYADALSHEILLLRKLELI